MATAAMEEVIVLYPSPALGHLFSMVELGKLILHHRPSINLIILLTQSPFTTNAASYIASVSSAVPSISFHNLPPIPLDPSNYSDLLYMAWHLIKLNNTHVDAALRSIGPAISALVIDLFCFPAINIAANLGIPVYTFFTSGAGCLTADLHLPHLLGTITQNFKDLDYTVNIPALPPIPLNHMPEPSLVRDTQVYDYFVDSMVHLSKTAGILINTFESLEPEPVKALSDGLQIPNCLPSPPVFCIGPLIATSAKKIDEQGAECLRWLDSQPKRSVVYLCFGSMGMFSKQQLMEIAVGLERSGQRFLWVVRSLPSEQEQQKTAGLLSGADQDLESLLPEGFLGRTRERGFVVKTWVPQVEVLSHGSVGGFVTHCGWNSALEAVQGGVAMVAWPLYAEQKLNKVLLTEAMDLAVAMEVPESGLVSGEEVEKRVREVMEPEAAMMTRVTSMKHEASAALSEGGSSGVAIRRFIDGLFVQSQSAK